MNHVKRVTVIGGGIVGRSWAIVFSRGGYEVNLYEAIPEVAQSALIWVSDTAKDLEKYGLLRNNKAEDVIKRVRISPTLEEAVKDVVWVQECVPESVDHKKKVFETLDNLVEKHIILASSSSSIPPSAFTSHLNTKSRMLVAHPVNPPHLIPLVEVVPSPDTSPSVVEFARSLMEEIGQSPIVVKKEIDSFILNRLQGALLNEAFKLVQDDYITPEDLDRTMKDGLGLRWSFMGPFETIDLNAPGGVEDYIKRYGPNFLTLAKQQADIRAWEGPVVETVTNARRSILSIDKLPERGNWRNQRLMGLMSHKTQMEQQDKK